MIDRSNGERQIFISRMFFRLKDIEDHFHELTGYGSELGWRKRNGCRIGVMCWLLVLYKIIHDQTASIDPRRKDISMILITQDCAEMCARLVLVRCRNPSSMKSQQANCQREEGRQLHNFLEQLPTKNPQATYGQNVGCAMRAILPGFWSVCAGAEDPKGCGRVRAQRQDHPHCAGDPL